MKSFIAREPIFDRNREVYGYEMKLRSGPMSLFDQPEQAGAGVVVNQSLLEDVQALSSGKRAFIPATSDALLNDYAVLLPREWLAIELRDSAEAGPELVAACRRLKDAGYTLVLGDCGKAAATRDWRSRPISCGRTSPLPRRSGVGLSLGHRSPPRAFWPREWKPARLSTRR